MSTDRRRSLQRWTLLVTVISMLSARSATADLTGWWRMRLGEGPVRFVYVTQTNDDVAFTFFGNDYHGELSNGALRMTGPLPSGTPRCTGGFLGAAVNDQDRRIDGGFFDIGIGCIGPFAGTFFGRRCECYDENTQDGDGCDASCRIESCFTCSGDPSECVPTPDGGACDDRRDCTIGERCSAGTCAGGSPVEPCFDLSGRWRWISEYDGFPDPFVETLTLEQREGYVVTHPESVGGSGPVNVATGTFSLKAPPLDEKDYLIGPFCDPISNGQVSADGNSVAGSVSSNQWGATYCGGFTGTLRGRRLCAGDCDEDGQVVIGELVTSVNIALERAPLEQCEGVDTDGSGAADVSELTSAVNRLLHGCP